MTEVELLFKLVEVLGPNGLLLAVIIYWFVKGRKCSNRMSDEERGYLKEIRDRVVRLEDHLIDHLQDHS